MTHPTIDFTLPGTMERPPMRFSIPHMDDSEDPCVADMCYVGTIDNPEIRYWDGEKWTP